MLLLYTGPFPRDPVAMDTSTLGRHLGNQYIMIRARLWVGGLLGAHGQDPHIQPTVYHTEGAAQLPIHSLLDQFSAAPYL